MDLGSSTFALMAFGFLALGAVLRAVAGCRAGRMLTTVLLCTCLGVSAANAEPLASDANAPRQSPPIGAPVLEQAENATTDATSPIAEGSFPSATAAPSIMINPKSANSDQNCLALAKAAAAHDLPLDFFVRLIRQESNFDPNSVSHKGAQGIAQFMPGTARWRGLADPFEPLQALYESARWLRELREQFGNLGLAAAAYNAGPGRVQDWLAGRGGLPGETRACVRIITGRAAEEWAKGPVEDRVGPQQWLTCTELARTASVAPLRKAASVEKDRLGAVGSSTHGQLVGSQGAVRLQATSEAVFVRIGRSCADDHQGPNAGPRLSALVPDTGGRIDPRSRQAALLAPGVGWRQLPSVSELAEGLIPAVCDPACRIPWLTPKLQAC